MDVALIRWPEEAERRRAAREAGMPRLLLVGSGTPPPTVTETIEDWIRVPAPDADVQARVATLEARARAEVPEVDDDGILRLGDRWVPLSPVGRRLVAELLARYGAVVDRDALSRAVWPGGAPSRNTLDVHVLRLRRRVDEVGLEIRTVRSRGYVLQRRSGEEVET